MSKFFKRFFLIVFAFSTPFSYSQKSDESSEDKYDTWAIGAGFSLLSLHGDLRSFDTYSGDAYMNYGGFVYIDKMFNPILGIEMKFNISQIAGEDQRLNNSGGTSETSYYRILYAERYISDITTVKGLSYGFESNLILNLDNLWKRHSNRWSFSSYFGAGYMKHNSRLIIKDYDYDPALGNDPASDYSLGRVDKDGTIRDADFRNNSNRDFSNFAGTLYLNAGIGVKFRFNEEFDIEARGVLNLANEDHLDAAISQRQIYESFFTGNIGVVYKFGSRKKYAIWVQDEVIEPFVLIDTDGDGVIDEMDKEMNTPLGAEVYGNGVAIDTDKDGIKDYEDSCPFVPGVVERRGCPIDPIVVNEEPIVEAAPVVAFQEDEKNDIADRIAMLSKAIYFKTNSDQLKEESYKPLNEISAIMFEYPQSKFKIEGHTDSRGKDSYNLDLSKRRAKTVEDYLTNKGISNNRLSSKGYGEVNPIATNETESGRQMNRRVEINFIDPDSEEGRLVYDQGVVIKSTANRSSLIGSSYSSGGMVPARDTDNDGVADVYDKEPNTPKESRVYGDGVSIDSDMDSVPDYLDGCPFAKGPVANNGCPAHIQESTFSNPINTTNGQGTEFKAPSQVANKEVVTLSSGSVEGELKKLISEIKFSRSEGHVLKTNNILVLEKIGAVLNSYPNVSVSIEVHTNNKPNLKYNLDLSKRRAFAIKKHLTQVSGISSARLEVDGLGGARPKYNTEDKAENSKNNRVEITVK